MDVITGWLHTGNHMVTRPRNPDRTRRAILDSAAVEFCAAGPAGARIDAIAASAGVNKRMLYHYFASKDGLFAAVLDDRLATDRVGAAGSLVDRHTDASNRPDQIRLLMWEALAAEQHADSVRAAPWRARVADLEMRQQAGTYPSELDAAQLELTFAAIALFPFAFPQLTRLITGVSPTDEAFVAARSAFLVALESRLVRKTDAPDAPKPRYRLAASITESPPLRGK
jgi:TetR/AcrR family transcriptional regulator